MDESRYDEFYSDDEDGVCGESWDHTLKYVYEGPDGVQWTCIECGAEGWEEPDDS